MKISKLNLRQLFAKGVKPAQEAFYNWFDSYWHKDELITIDAVSGLQNQLSNKLDVSAQDTLITAFNNALKEASFGLKGIAIPSTVPTAYNPTTHPDGLYEKYDVKVAGTFAHFLKSDSQPVIITTDDLKGLVQIAVVNGVADKLLKPLPAALNYILSFNDSSFPIIGYTQRKHEGSIWELASDVTAQNVDIPGISPKWKLAVKDIILEKTNLYDGTFVPGFYIASNGDITPGIGWAYVRIPAEQLNAYMISGFVGLSIMVRYEGVTNNLLSAQGFFNPPSRGITTPANCAFFCFNVKHPDLPNEYLNVKVNKGSVIISDEYKIRSNFSYLFNNNTTIKKSKWDGEIIDVFGDSTVAGGTYGSWVPEVATLLGATIRNWGSSGAQAKRIVEIINGTGGWNTAFQQYGNNGVPNFTNTKAVVFKIGHNENMNTMGSIADIDNKVQSQYADTMVGNLAKAIEIILSQNINCKIYICTIHKNIGYVEQVELNWTRSPQISAKLVDVANYYSLPIIDVLNESNINKKNTSIMTYDGLHLSTQGNKNMARCIAAGLMYK